MPHLAVRLEDRMNFILPFGALLGIFRGVGHFLVVHCIFLPSHNHFRLFGFGQGRRNICLRETQQGAGTLRPLNATR